MQFIKFWFDYVFKKRAPRESILVMWFNWDKDMNK